MENTRPAKQVMSGLVLGCAVALTCGCASIDGPASPPGAPGSSRVVAAKPNHRQYFDQNRGRYYYFDQTAHRYFWEDGTPRD